MREFTAVSLFCGAGGLDMGFERAGFRTIWANDFDKDACKTHQNWSRAKVVCGDIGKVDISQIPDSDIILGGFPCQGFSLSGPRKIDDSRNVLYKHYVRIVKEKQPLIFVGENVKGLLTMGDGKIIEAIIAEFSDCGYDVFLQLVNAKDFGVPQDRERVIICGFRKDLKIKNFEIPVPNNMRKSRTTRVEAINIAGTLNSSSGDEKAITKVPILKMPTQFYHIGFKPNSDNTVEVVCDEGWQISMRIHNASSRVEPSLKFDVQLISFPSSVYAQVEPWESEEERMTKRVMAYADKLSVKDNQ